MTPLEDKLYMALMAAKQFMQPKVRGDLRDVNILRMVEGAITAYQTAKEPPPGKAETEMDWDSVKEIAGG